MRFALVPTIIALAAGTITVLAVRTATAVSRPVPDTSAQAPALSDANIVAIFDAANTDDIETGDLAARQGSTEAVRELGARFARDHRAVRQQGRSLAAKLGLHPALPANDHDAADQAALMARLHALHGAAFDSAYLHHEVSFHQAVIAEVEHTLLPAIHDPELKALVQQVAPAFQAHLMAAQHLAQQLGY